MRQKRRSQKKKCLTRLVYFNDFDYCVFIRNTGAKSSKLFQKRIDKGLFDWMSLTLKELKKVGYASNKSNTKKN